MAIYYYPYHPCIIHWNVPVPIVSLPFPCVLWLDLVACRYDWHSLQEQIPVKHRTQNTDIPANIIDFYLSHMTTNVFDEYNV